MWHIRSAVSNIGQRGNCLRPNLGRWPSHTKLAPVIALSVRLTTRQLRLDNYIKIKKVKVI